MKNLRPLIALSVAAVMLAAVATAFGAAAHSSAVVKTKSTSLGTILVTSSGHTLYLDVGDKPPKFACNGGCIGIWPILSTSGKPKASGSAKESLLGTVKHGKVTQVTYAGHPLYTFASDTSSSPTSGEGVNGFFVVSPSGSKITKAAKKTTTSSTTTSGGGGYGY
jgi:predicted lipoprotein with Yx(FWY)xxD motif